MAPSSPIKTIAPQTGVGSTAVDRFGNKLAEGLPYARGNLIRDTPDDLNKLKRVEKVARERLSTGKEVFNFTGLERNITQVMTEELISQLDDCWAPALYGEKLKELGLKHLGGNPDDHDVCLVTRQTAAIVASMQVLLNPGDLVIGVAPTYTHPCLIRAVKLAGGRFTEGVNLQGFKDLLEKHKHEAKLVAITRLAVTYDIIPNDELLEIVKLAKTHGLRIFVDDAGGGRVGPAIYNQPRMIELDCDLGSTGLDKYGTLGPRVGLVGGKKELVSLVWSKAIELGCECRQMLWPAVVNTLDQYKDELVQKLVATTMVVGTEMSKIFDKEEMPRVRNNGLIAQIKGEDLLEIMLERRGMDLAKNSQIIVPFEATAMVAVSMMERYGAYLVNIAAIPSGTTSLMIKFVREDLLEQFGGAAKFAAAIDDCVNHVASIIDKPEKMMELLGQENIKSRLMTAPVMSAAQAEIAHQKHEKEMDKAESEEPMTPDAKRIKLSHSG